MCWYFIDVLTAWDIYYYYDYHFYYCYYYYYYYYFNIIIFVVIVIIIIIAVIIIIIILLYLAYLHSSAGTAKIGYQQNSKKNISEKSTYHFRVMLISWARFWVFKTLLVWRTCGLKFGTIFETKICTGHILLGNLRRSWVTEGPNYASLSYINRI